MPNTSQLLSSRLRLLSRLMVEQQDAWNAERADRIVDLVEVTQMLQIVKKMVEMTQLTPQERTQEYIVEQTGSRQQPHRSQQQHQAVAAPHRERQEHRKEQEEEERWGRKPKRKERVSEKGKTEKKEVKEEERKKETRMDMNWTMFTRRMRQRRSQGQGAVSEENRTSRSGSKVFRIFVKMENSKALMVVVAPNDKMSDVVRRIPSSAGYGKRDVHVTFEGRVLKKSDEVKACGIREESTIHGAKCRARWRATM